MLWIMLAHVENFLLKNPTSFLARIAQSCFPDTTTNMLYISKLDVIYHKYTKHFIRL